MDNQSTGQPTISISQMQEDAKRRIQEIESFWGEKGYQRTPDGKWVKMESPTEQYGQQLDITGKELDIESQKKKLEGEETDWEQSAYEDAAGYIKELIDLDLSDEEISQKTYRFLKLIYRQKVSDTKLRELASMPAPQPTAEQPITQPQATTQRQPITAYSMGRGVKRYAPYAHPLTALVKGIRQGVPQEAYRRAKPKALDFLRGLTGR